MQDSPQHGMVSHAEGNRLIVGDPTTFAIESEIAEAYERLGLRALGFFVIHLMGRSYGVTDPVATMLAKSFDTVGERIAKRGRHNPPFPPNADAGEIVTAVSRAIYTDCDERELFFGQSVRGFVNAIQVGRLIWAPDGDEAFDDSSHLLQYDVGDWVRLIAFRRARDPLYDPESVRETWLTAEVFYGVLQNWYDRFLDEWT
ncbi:MAG: Imm42 family immunity protein, partial [Acidobacteriaceae bacterium]